MKRKLVVNVAEARARLPELIERAAKGEEIILARAGKPRAKLVPLRPAGPGKRVPGKGNGRFRTKKAFDDPLPDDFLGRLEAAIERGVDEVQRGERVEANQFLRELRARR